MTSKTTSIRLRSAGLVVGLVGLALMQLQGQAFAASASTSLSVTVTVENNCSIATTALALGSYDPIVANDSTALDGTGAVTIACTKGAVTTVGLGLGSNADGSTRRLANGSSYLTYEIYKDPSRSSVWGSSGADLLDTGTSPSKAGRTYTVYGRVLAGQDVPAGTYSDSVTATVNF